MTAKVKNLNRYEIAPTADGTMRCLWDRKKRKFVPGPGGEFNMSARDAHDLREEYRWS